MDKLQSQAYNQVRQTLMDAYHNEGDPDLVYRLVRELEQIGCQLALLSGAKAQLCREFPHLEPLIEGLESNRAGGSGPWLFEEHIGFVCDDGGQIYVSDSVNNCIQHFDADGTFIKTIGSKGDAQGAFKHPRGLALGDDGTLYVADNSNHRIQVFANYDGEYVFTFAFGCQGNGWGQFQGPTDVALDKKGHIYVTDGNDRVQKFDVLGKPLLVISGPAPMQDRGREGYLKNPFGLVVDASGKIFVADAGYNRIQVFDADGDHIHVIGGYGTEDGEFDQPLDLVLDDEGNIYVVECLNHRVQIFDKMGLHLSTFGSMGQYNGQLYKPCGISLDRNGDIYVADTGNHRIQKFGGLQTESPTPEVLLGDVLSGPQRDTFTQFLKKINGPIFDYINCFNAFIRATSPT